MCFFWGLLSQLRPWNHHLLPPNLRIILPVYTNVCFRHWSPISPLYVSSNKIPSDLRMGLFVQFSVRPEVSIACCGVFPWHSDRKAQCLTGVFMIRSGTHTMSQEKHQGRNRIKHPRSVRKQRPNDNKTETKMPSNLKKKNASWNQKTNKQNRTKCLKMLSKETS